MTSTPFNWQCPYCNFKVTITSDLYSSNAHYLHIANARDRIALVTAFMVCPNAECRQPTLEAKLVKWFTSSTGNVRYGTDALEVWRLQPFGTARPWPDYVPQAIRADYTEACLVRDLSPKSAATLARRALQGILRDFFGAKPGRLVDEIDSLSDQIEPDLLNAIHGVRRVGNIGAHMESDISLIVDVDPSEAQLLIELVETMIEETYVRRDERRRRIERVTALATAKDRERKESSL